MVKYWVLPGGMHQFVAMYLLLLTDKCLPCCDFPVIFMVSFAFWLQGYAWEITTPEGGYGLDELLSSRKAVINGMHFELHINDAIYVSRYFIG